MTGYRRWTIAGIVLVALYTSGLAHGRPRPEYSPTTVQDAWLNGATVYHPDEFAYVGIPFRMLLTNEWNPHYYHNPSLTIYTNVGLFALAGAENFPHDLSYDDRAIAPFQLYVMARYLSALVTLLSVVLTYVAGRVAFNRRAGLVAAALVGLSPLMVQHAHYATPNAQTTMLATAALMMGVIILKDAYSPRLPVWLVYMAGGLLVGLTMSARYNAAVVGLVTGLALLTAGWRHRSWLPVVLGFAMMPLGFVIGTPGAVLVTSEVVQQVREILNWYRERGDGPGFTTDRGLSGLYYHWRYIVLIAVGPAGIAAALVGLGAALWTRRWMGIVFTLYLVTYTVLALPGRRIQANLLLPPVAPLALLAGYGVVWTWERLARRRWLTEGLVVLLLAWPVTVSLLFAYRIVMPDNRMRAQEWIYEHVPRGTRVYLLGPYNVPLDPLDYKIRQTYAREAKPDDIRESKVPIIVYSDAYPFLVLRDPALSKDFPNAPDREREITRILDTDWIELARFERTPWPAENFPPDDVSYWHQIEIVIYCNPADCPVGITR